MRRLTLIILLIPMMAWGDISGTFTANGDSADFTITNGAATIYIGSANGQDFGGGTVTVWCDQTDINAGGFGSEEFPSATTFTAADFLTFEAAFPVVCRLTLTSSTSPDLDYYVDTQ